MVFQREQGKDTGIEQRLHIGGDGSDAALCRRGGSAAHVDQIAQRCAPQRLGDQREQQPDDHRDHRAQRGAKPFADDISVRDIAQQHRLQPVGRAGT